MKPQRPILGVNENPLVVVEKEQKEVECTVTAARPAARVRWFVGTEDVTSRSRSENIPTDNKVSCRSLLDSVFWDSIFGCMAMELSFHYMEGESLNKIKESCH